MLSNMILVLLIFICVIGVSSSYKKDVIRISIDSNKPLYYKDKNNKNVRIEINKGQNQSNKNNEDTHSDDHVLYEIGSKLNKEIQQDTKKNSHEDYEWHGSKVLSSIEETDDLWNDNHKNNVLLNEQTTDQNFVDGILNSYKNTRKVPPIYATQQINRNESRKTNEHHSNVKIDESNSEEPHEGNIEGNKNGNRKENGELDDSRNNQDEENKCVFDSNVFDDTAKAPCNGEAGNLDYQERRVRKESEEQDSLADYSYSVSVQRKGSHYASGALVGERWVLSSAAEFYNVRETIKLFRMRMGSADCKKGGLLTAVQSITVHPRFAPGSPSYDIAILRSAEPVVTSEIRPIAMTKMATGRVVKAKYLATYWPRIVVKNMVIPQTAAERVLYNSMRVSIQKLVPFEKCRRKIAAGNVSLDGNSLCLKPVKAHHSKCMPDAGAPVAGKDGLWGITSGWVSPDCPSTILPTVFTRVATLGVRSWINEQTHL